VNFYVDEVCDVTIVEDEVVTNLEIPVLVIQLICIHQDCLLMSTFNTFYLTQISLIFCTVFTYIYQVFVVDIKISGNIFIFI